MSARSIVCLLVCAAAACAAGPPPGEVPSNGRATTGPAAEPVGFLLEYRDSLRLSDSVTAELVQLNLRLFRRNRTVQRAMDSIAGWPAEGPFGPGMRPDATSPEMRERMAPLVEQLAAQNAAARDTAWAMLTEEQRERARQLEERARRPGRGQPRP